MFDWLKKRVWQEMSYEDVPAWVMKTWGKKPRKPDFNYYFRGRTFVYKISYMRTMVQGETKTRYFKRLRR